MSSRLGASTIILPMVAMLLLAACAGQLQIPAQEGGGAAPPQSGEVAASWQSGAAMPTARSEMRVAVVDGIFYVPGRIRRVDRFAAYDPCERQLDEAGADAGTGAPYDGDRSRRQGLCFRRRA